MALIDSPRLTDADREYWTRVEHYDHVLARDRSLDRLAERGRAAIREWAAAGPGVCTVSWGKDSVVAGSLVATSGVDVPLVWARSDPFETPECEQVRDAFLARYPHVRYEERTAHLRNPKRGERGHEAHVSSPDRRSQDVLAELVPERYVSGVRGQESRIRSMSIAHRGMVTQRTCRPLARWTAEQVFAYLHREELPVHPVYAMTVGGGHDRRWLRVHPLCSAPPATRSAVHGLDMVAWEDRYYGDVIAAAVEARAHMWVGDGRGHQRRLGREHPERLNELHMEELRKVREATT